MARPEELLARILAVTEGFGLFVVAVLAIYLPGRYVVVPLVQRVLDAAGLDPTWELPLLKLARAAFLVFGLFVGVTLSGFASFLAATEIVVAAVTIALGFASKDVLGNFVSGAIIVIDPQYNIGDWIEWDGKEGIIEDISFRVTRVHTFDNELISVPNSELTSNAVTNPVAKERRRVSYEIGIGYDDDISAARAVIVDVAADHPEILGRPAPTVHVLELAESAVVLVAQFWIDQPARTDFVRIRSEFVTRVKVKFDEAGIEIPYPYRELTGRIETTVRADDGPGYSGLD